MNENQKSNGNQLLGEKLNAEQKDILDHTEHRAAGGLYCGGGKDMDELVAAGLMEFAGRKSFVPDPYYRITSAGREALRATKQKSRTCTIYGGGITQFRV